MREPQGHPTVHVVVVLASSFLLTFVFFVEGERHEDCFGAVGAVCGFRPVSAAAAGKANRAVAPGQRLSYIS